MPFDPQNPDFIEKKFLDHHARWKLNRDMVSGAAAVRAGNYLPDQTLEMGPEGFANYKRRAKFFAASSRTLNGLQGLIFRKAPVLGDTTIPQALLYEITADRQSVQDCAERLVRETLITNFSILLTDNPPLPPKDISAEEAEQRGYRPFWELYKAESICDIQRGRGVSMSTRPITYVRLIDNVDQVRVLEMIEGVYTVTFYNRTNTTWTKSKPLIPLRDSKPLTDIPIQIICTDNGAIEPTKAEIDDVADMNLIHYINAAEIAQILYASRSGILWGANMDPDFTPDLRPGKFNNLGDGPEGGSDPIMDVIYPAKESVQTLQAEQSVIKSEMAAVGARMLAPDKNAAEAADTVAIRQIGENSILAKIANTISDRIGDSLSWVQWWMGGEAGQVSYRLNTDFGTQSFNAQDFAALANLWEKGGIPLEVLHDDLRAAGKISEDVTNEDLARMLRSSALDN